ncbi:hypothetical protein N5U55_04050 [Aliarcobacter butzleri]|uniref:hypothetical protein n=1 Tax=Aliarcobacter butzleri TaxID=28197 RepID=UPI0021B24517|nr:hypothetical protein [Aliarcobacter butzleri]MCT7583281.1 hypothetical protein [Aliarcobacter butzleri]
MCVFLLYCLFFYCFKANKECQKALKEIAETDEEIAKVVAEDLERETEEYIKTRASIAVKRNEPHAFITSAFDWSTSEKGSEYWSEMTHKFCDSHPMVSAEELPEEDEEDSIECDNCGSTNVSVSCFGDRTGVNCRDCGESSLLVD